MAFNKSSFDSKLIVFLTAKQAKNFVFNIKIKNWYFCRLNIKKKLLIIEFQNVIFLKPT